MRSLGWHALVLVGMLQSRHMATSDYLRGHATPVPSLVASRRVYPGGINPAARFENGHAVCSRYGPRTELFRRTVRASRRRHSAYASRYWLATFPILSATHVDNARRFVVHRRAALARMAARCLPARHLPLANVGGRADRVVGAGSASDYRTRSALCFAPPRADHAQREVSRYVRPRFCRRHSRLRYGRQSNGKYVADARDDRGVLPNAYAWSRA